MKLVYPTDFYPCNYSQDYNDYYQIYQGCSPAQTITPGPPCAVYDSNLRLCLACIPTYLLKNGQCIQNTSCGSGQYWHFGECFEVDPNCKTYDYFTG